MLRVSGPGADCLPRTRMGKVRRRSMDASTAAHKNKWESAVIMGGYGITAITPVPHPGYGAIITIRTDSDKLYNLSISNLPECDCEDFKNMALKARSPKWVPCKHFYYVFMYLCKMDIDTHMFIHAPTYSYNEVMEVLELAGIVDPEE